MLNLHVGTNDIRINIIKLYWHFIYTLEELEKFLLILFV